MRRIILFIASSLDGYIAGPNEEIDWLFTDGDYGFNDFFSSVDTTLMGNKTWKLSLSFAPDPFPGKKNFIFTRQRELPHHEKGTYVNTDIIEFTKQLQSDPGKDIWLVGGGEIVKVFMEHGLIDQVVLSIHPITLGKGLPLFPAHEGRTSWILKETKTWDNGLVQLHYDRRT